MQPRRAVSCIRRVKRLQLQQLSTRRKAEYRFGVQASGLSTYFAAVGTPTGGCRMPTSDLTDSNGNALPFAALNVNRAPGATQDHLVRCDSHDQLLCIVCVRAVLCRVVQRHLEVFGSAACVCVQHAAHLNHIPRSTFAVHKTCSRRNVCC